MMMDNSGMMKNQNAIRLVAVFLMLILIPSVLAECFDANGWMEQAKKFVEKRYKEEGFGDRVASNDDMAAVIADSISKTGKFDPLKTRAYFEGCKAKDAAESLTKLGDTAALDALGRAIESSQIDPQKVIEAAQILKTEGYRIKPGDVAEIAKQIPKETYPEIYSDPTALAMMRVAYSAADLVFVPDLFKTVAGNPDMAKQMGKKAANALFFAERYTSERESVRDIMEKMKANPNMRVSDAMRLSTPEKNYKIGGSSVFTESFPDSTGRQNNGPLSALARAIELGMKTHEIGIGERSLWNPTAGMEKYNPEMMDLMKKLASENGVELTAHGPIYDAMPGFFDGMSPAEKASRMLQASKEAVDVASKIGAKTMVMHMSDPANVNSLVESIKYARGKGVKILVENTYQKDAAGKNQYHTGDQFIKGLDNIVSQLAKEGIDAKNIGIIVDVAHFNVAGNSPADTLGYVKQAIAWAESKGIKIDEVHLNQNSGKADPRGDAHRGSFADGTVPIEESVDLLKAHNKDLKIILEQADVLQGDASKIADRHPDLKVTQEARVPVAEAAAPAEIARTPEQVAADQMIKKARDFSSSEIQKRGETRTATDRETFDTFSRTIATATGEDVAKVNDYFKRDSGEMTEAKLREIAVAYSKTGDSAEVIKLKKAIFEADAKKRGASDPFSRLNEVSKGTLKLGDAERVLIPLSEASGQGRELRTITDQELGRIIDGLKGLHDMNSFLPGRMSLANTLMNILEYHPESLSAEGRERALDTLKGFYGMKEGGIDPQLSEILKAKDPRNRISNIEKSLHPQQSSPESDFSSDIPNPQIAAERELKMQREGTPYVPERYKSGPEALPPEVKALEGAEKVGAMGDVHGNGKAMEQALENAGFIDSKGDWIAGKAVFVFTGDLVDAGGNSGGVLDVIMNLQKQAEAAGGRIIVLRGNHDQMMLDSLKSAAQSGDRVNFEDKEAWRAAWDAGDPEASTDANTWWWQGGDLTAQSVLTRAGIDTKGKSNQQLFEMFVDYMKNTKKGQEYVQWMEKLPYAARINNLFFVHGAPDLGAERLQDVAQGSGARQNVIWGRDWWNNPALIKEVKRKMGLGEKGAIVFGHTGNPNSPRNGFISPDQGVFGINFVPRRAYEGDAEGVLIFDKDGVNLKFGDQSQAKWLGDVGFEYERQQKIKQLEAKATGQKIADPLGELFKPYITEVTPGLIKSGEMKKLIRSIDSTDSMTVGELLSGIRELLSKTDSLENDAGRVYSKEQIQMFMSAIKDIQYKIDNLEPITSRDLIRITNAGGIRDKIILKLKKRGIIK